MKSITTFILLFVVICSYGQSKEETQEWIAYQISSNSYKDVSSINAYKLRFENSQIIINNLFKRVLPNTEETYVVTYHIPLNDIKSISIEEKNNSISMYIETKSGNESIKYIPPLFVKKKQKGHTLMYELPGAKIRMLSKIEILLSKSIKVDNRITKLIEAFDHLMIIDN